MDKQELLEGMLAGMRKAAELVRQADHDAMRIDEKGGDVRNLVTEYDLKVQQLLHDLFLEMLPQARFIGEESDNYGDFNQGYCFIIDPIDGTVNFSRDGHHSCISAALTFDGQLIVGVICDPYLDEYFYATQGGGAFVNGKSLNMPQRPLSDSVVGFGTCPYDMSLVPITFELACKTMLAANDMRRSGSAALDLAYVASGRYDLFYEFILYPWDYAAGALLVQEAGGIITDMHGEPLRFDCRCGVMAGNKVNHPDFLNLASEIYTR